MNAVRRIPLNRKAEYKNILQLSTAQHNAAKLSSAESVSQSAVSQSAVSQSAVSSQSVSQSAVSQSAVSQSVSATPAVGDLPGPGFPKSSVLPLSSSASDSDTPTRRRALIWFPAFRCTSSTYCWLWIGFGFGPCFNGQKVF